MNVKNGLRGKSTGAYQSGEPVQLVLIQDKINSMKKKGKLSLKVI